MSVLSLPLSTHALLSGILVAEVASNVRQISEPYELGLISCLPSPEAEARKASQRLNDLAQSGHLLHLDSAVFGEKAVQRWTLEKRHVSGRSAIIVVFIALHPGVFHIRRRW